MNRRAFIGCIGCAGAWTLAGCVSPPTPEERVARDHPGWDISVCGLNCAKCRLREKGECAGCRGPKEENWSPGCEFRPCARERGHRYCFECADFPCSKLQAFASDGHEHHRLAVENLKAMKAVGLERWLAQQPRPMFCPGWKF